MHGLLQRNRRHRFRLLLGFGPRISYASPFNNRHYDEAVDLLQGSIRKCRKEVSSVYRGQRNYFPNPRKPEEKNVNMKADIIKTVFPHPLQRSNLAQFEQLFPLYAEWNEKINVISRKDIDNLMLHHVLHSLAIAKFIDFKPGTEILRRRHRRRISGDSLGDSIPRSEFSFSGQHRKEDQSRSRRCRFALGLKNVHSHTRSRRGHRRRIRIHYF